jgi:putative acetyltransferase
VSSPLLVRSLKQDDWDQVIDTYADAVKTLATPLYRPEQIEAWAAYPSSHAAVREALGRGVGLVGTTAGRPSAVEAFALLDPLDRLALLYCRGRSSRMGLATRLVQGLEAHARQLGQTSMRTEASQLSRPLLERLGWKVEQEERILFAGELFLRWRMRTTLI